MNNARACIALFAISVCGCGITERPYHDAEARHFSDIQSPPTLAEFRDDGLYSRNFEQDFPSVWHICLDMAAQGAGIIALSRTSDSLGRLVFVASSPRELVPRYISKFAGEAITERIEVWLAVEVRSLSTGTQLTVAWIDSSTSKPAPVTTTGQNGRAPDGEKLGIAASAILDFQDAVRSALDAPRLAEKFSDIPARTRSGGPASIQTPSAEWAAYSKAYGDYASAKLRSEQYVIRHRTLEQNLDRIVRRLLLASGTGDTRAKVYVYATGRADREPPIALANGDIFVASGFLDNVQDTDQLAGALAHEIDHIVQQDPIKRRRKELRAANMKFNLSIAGTVIGFAGAIAYNPKAWFVTTPNDTAEFRLARGVGLAIMTGSLATAIVTGTEAGEITVGSYAVDQELRADHNATISLWRAGFRHSALREVLEWL